MPLHRTVPFSPGAGCSRCEHLPDLASICGVSGLIRPWRSKTACPVLSVVGSGQLRTPWERRQRAKSSMPLSVCCTWVLVDRSRCAQALWAAWNCELLTPSCCMVTLGIAPLLSGSGNCDTPWERMQPEKARPPFCRADAAGELLEVL